LYGYLRRYVGDDDLAADVFQNTWVAVFRKIQQYEPGRPARPWLYAIATNQAIDAMRRRGRRVESSNLVIGPEPGEEVPRPLTELLAAPGPDPAEVTIGAETQARVRAAVDSLPELLRQVVIMVYFQGLKYQDVADILGVPLGTVKSRIHAALAKLGDIWDDG
jgi:RNA polymerase sigma-70 factor (ECF subfamily)